MSSRKPGHSVDPRFDTRRDPRFKKTTVKETKTSESKKAPKVDPFGQKKKKDAGEKHIDELYQFEDGTEVKSEEKATAYNDKGEFVWNAESSGEEESEMSEGEFEEGNDAWDRVDDSVVIGEETFRRLALMGLDWDNITAADIFVLLESFLATNSRKGTLNHAQGSGLIESVKIFLSDFGAERLELEKVQGPLLNLPRVQVHRKDVMLSDDESSSDSEESDMASAAGSDDRSENFKTALESASEHSSAGDSSDEDSSDDEFVVKKASDRVGQVAKAAAASDDESSDSSEEESGNEDEDLLKANRRAAKMRRAISEQFQRNKEAEKKAAEAMRTYQKERSKYFYCIVTLKDIPTAEKVYEMLDGLDAEFALDGLDLRFVPDDVVPPRAPKDSCLKVPASYTPPEAFASALRTTKVDCTWDETPAQRTRMLKRKFSKHELAELDLKAYLASDSEESENDQQSEEETVTVDKIAQYRSALLGDLVGDKEDEQAMASRLVDRRNRDKKKDKKQQRQLLGLDNMVGSDNDSDVDMEIRVDKSLDKFTDDIKRRAAAAGDNVWNLVPEEDSRTLWQKYLDKQKEKKKTRKEGIKEKIRASRNEDSDEDDIDSGDDLLADEKRTARLRAEKEKKREMLKKVSGIANEEEDENRKAELELLLGGDKEDRHFDMRPQKKSVAYDEEGNKLSWKERMKVQKKEARALKENPLAQKAAEEAARAVTAAVEELAADDRFGAMFEGGEMAQDPTNPAFKDTQTNREIRKKRLEMNGVNKRKKLLGGN